MKRHHGLQGVGEDGVGASEGALTQHSLPSGFGHCIFRVLKQEIEIWAVRVYRGFLLLRNSTGLGLFLGSSTGVGTSTSTNTKTSTSTSRWKK
jgi:hypothetical protein